MTLNQRIRQRMADTGIDCVDLSVRLRANGADVSYHAVYSWWIGRSDPQAATVPAVAAALGLGVDELYNYVGPADAAKA